MKLRVLSVLIPFALFCSSPTFYIYTKRERNIKLKGNTRMLIASNINGMKFELLFASVMSVGFDVIDSNIKISESDVIVNGNNIVCTKSLNDKISTMLKKSKARFCGFFYYVVKKIDDKDHNIIFVQIKDTKGNVYLNTTMTLIKERESGYNELISVITRKINEIVE